MKAEARWFADILDVSYKKISKAKDNSKAFRPSEKQ